MYLGNRSECYSYRVFKFLNQAGQPVQPKGYQKMEVDIKKGTMGLGGLAVKQRSKGGESQPTPAARGWKIAFPDSID